MLHRVGILGFSFFLFFFFCPKQGQGLKTSVALLYPNMGQVPRSIPPPGIVEDRGLQNGEVSTAHDINKSTKKVVLC